MDNLKLNIGTINIKEPGNFGFSPFKIKNEDAPFNDASSLDIAISILFRVMSNLKKL